VGGTRGQGDDFQDRDPGPSEKCTGRGNRVKIKRKEKRLFKGYSGRRRRGVGNGEGRTNLNVLTTKKKSPSTIPKNRGGEKGKEEQRS